MALRLKYKTWHDNTPGREHRPNIICHKSYQCFLRSFSQGNRNKNKNKNKQMGPNQTYKLCTASMKVLVAHLSDSLQPKGR